jgi:uncharacterized OsmC-like protein
MSDSEDLRGLKDLLERKARVMAARPELARSSGHARVRLAGGMAYPLDAGGTPRPLDLRAVEAGAGAHPSPDDLLRASLAASLALGYRQWGARLDVPLSGIEVELRTDDDARGQLVFETDVVPGWLRIHIVVSVVSTAPIADVQRVVDCANRHCLVLATLSGAVERIHHLRVTAAKPSGNGP